MKQRFLGYLNTPFISGSNNIYGLKPYLFKNRKNYTFTNTLFNNQRLGKLVEQFVYFQLQQDDNVEILDTNVQIKDNKQTVGELDALLLSEGKPIHLEVIYKFYLYDTIHNYEEPLAYWIGPNRKDTLLYKLDKLKDKQFPLLYNELTQSYLQKHKLCLKTISQQLFFKAQLFMPYDLQDLDITPLNKDCIAGTYVSIHNISILKDFKFYVPKKLDWLIEPNNDVDWLDFYVAKSIIKNQIDENKSPLVWLKISTTEIKKCFITFW
ncbi:DUF1853 family protein [Winogradskyella echinorum]|nr:DUF1853 family protein [Winogradskyella echinorum]